MRPVPASPPTPRTRAIRHGLLAALVLLLAGAWFGRPASTNATSTYGAMEAQILGSINKDRAALGLHSLRLDSRLVTWSAERSSWMAARGILTWSRLRTDSLTLSCTLRNRARGSTWTLRVRARDNAGNVSGWLTSATFAIH
jgi:uncharacterized protein YkwD